jgi:hypothetical protein
MSGGLNLDNPNPVAFPATFDATVLEGGGYVSRDGMWSAYVNADVIAVWGEDEVLGRAAIVERLSARMRANFSRYHGTAENPRTWGDGGNLVHHALLLGLIREQTTETGERGWRILDRRPHWIVVGTGAQKTLRQIGGLPPEKQAVVDKASARQARLTATLDRKARERADARIAQAVRNIIHEDPDTLIPASWVALHWIPVWLAGTRLDAASAIIREAHHAGEIDRPSLKHWIRILETEAVVAIGRREQHRRELAALPEHASIPNADADALGGLL